jgi:hypothetical protein
MIITFGRVPGEAVAASPSEKANQRHSTSTLNTVVFMSATWPRQLVGGQSDGEVAAGVPHSQV